MKLSQLPQFARFLDSKDVKVLRHSESKLDLWVERREGRFDVYQNTQAWDVFGSARYVISFIAERHRFAKFVGVWEVLEKIQRGTGYRYRTQELGGFGDLEARLVVSWGEGTRSWAQWLDRRGDKEISELLPANYVKDFPGYYNFTLTYAELCQLVWHPDANREWHRMLSSVSAIYVVLDTVSGRQYIGSAYGAGGLWTRWVNYARSGSGGNKLLRELLARHPTRQRKFQFSVLRVLEPGIHKDDVLNHEVLMKRKLGSRAFGLNSN